MRPKLFLLVVIPLAVGIILAGMYFTSGQSSIDRVKTKSAPAAIEPTSAPLVEYRWREDPCHVLHFAGDVKERTGIIRAVFPGPIWEIEDEADRQLRTIHPFGVAAGPFYQERELDKRVSWNPRMELTTTTFRVSISAPSACSQEKSRPNLA